MNNVDCDTRALLFSARFSELTDGATCRELSAKLGLSRSAIWAYQAGTRMPKVPALEKIAGAYGVDPMWLMGADVPKYPKPASAAPQPDSPIRLADTLRLEEPAPEGAGKLRDLAPAWADCDFTLTCKGDGMIGARICDGDTVCIHSQTTVESGEIAAVLVDHAVMLKRVQFYPDHIVLESENPNIRPLTYWDSDMSRVRILGKATYFISKIR